MMQTTCSADTIDVIRRDIWFRRVWGRKSSRALSLLGILCLAVFALGTPQRAEAQVSCPLIGPGSSVTANATSQTCSSAASSAAPSVQINNRISSRFEIDITPNTGAAAPVNASCTGSGCLRVSAGTITCDPTGFTAACNVSYSFPDANGDTVSGSFTAPAQGLGSPTILPHTISGGVFRVVDNTPPTVAVNIVDASLSGSDNSSNVTFTFDEPVTGFSASDLTVVGGSISGFSFTNGATSGSAIFTADNDSMATGSVTVDAESYTDNAGNLGATGSDTVSVDTANPTVTSLDMPAAGTYNFEDDLNFTVNFDEAVTVDTSGGTPSIRFIPNGVGNVLSADFIGGSGTTALNFRHTLVVGGFDNLTGISIFDLSANGGTLQDAAGNDANLRLNNVGSGAGVVVDTRGAAITSVTGPADGIYERGDPIDFTITFDDVVTSTGSTHFRVLVGSSRRQVNFVSGSGTNTFLYRFIPISNFDADGIVIETTSLQIGSGSLRDSDGNKALLALNNIGDTSGILVDAVDRTVTISGGDAQNEATATRTITATLSSASLTNTVVNLAYSGTATGGGVDYTGPASVTVLAGSTTGTADITVLNDGEIEPDETIIVDIDTVTGGGSTTENGDQQQTFTITNDDFDTTAPTVLSITRGFLTGARGGAPIPETTDADIVSWFVKFSEDITRPVAADFAVTGTTSPVTISNVNNDEYEVSLAGGDIATVNGRVELSFAPGQTITDMTGNALNTAVAPSPNDNFFIMANDTDAPTLTSILRKTPLDEFTNADTLTWEVTFSEPVQTIDADDFSLTNNTTATLTVTPISGSVYEISASGGDLANLGTLASGGFERNVSLGLLTFRGITDLAGNILTSNQPTGVQETYKVYNDPISVEDIRLSPGLLGGQTVVARNPISWIVNLATPDSDFTLSPSDFTVTGTTATLSVSKLFGNTFEVGLSGGDLPTLNGPVSIALNSGLTDRYGNVTTNTTPTGTDESSVQIDNEPPVLTVSSTSPATVTGPFDISMSFSEPVNGFSAVDVQVTNGVRTFDSKDNQNFTATITPASAGPVIVTIAAGAARDLRRNESTAAELTRTFDAPPTVVSIERGFFNGNTPIPQTTDQDIVSWFVRFSEDVTRPVASDFVVTGTTSSVTISNVGDDFYEISLADGDIATTNGRVELNFAPGQTIADTTGNALADTTPSGANDNFFILVNDTDMPTLTSIVRKTPASENTNADSLVWTVTFSEAVQLLDAADFNVSGTTAVVSNVTGTGTTYDVTASGGNLPVLTAPSLNAVTVALELSHSSTIQDLAGNALTMRTATGTTESYNVNNAPLIVQSITRETVPSGGIIREVTNADSLGWVILFSSISDAFDLVPADFTLTGTTATIASVNRIAFGFEVVASGGDLANLDGNVSLGFSHTRPVDEFGNVFTNKTPTGPNEMSYTLDNTAPSLVSIVPNSGTVSPTDADTLTFVFTFSEDMDTSAGNVANLVATGTTATISFTPISASQGTVTLSGGDLADLNGPVTIGLNPTNNITDPASNALASIMPTGTNNNTVQVQNDTTAPTVDITSVAKGSVSTAFDVAFTFSEAVSGFSIGDIAVGNGSVTSFASTDATNYSATISPTADGTVSVDVPGGVAQDGAGNGNVAATTFSIENDTAAPTVTASTPPSAVNGPFDLMFSFTEDMTGLTASDFNVTNGTVVLTGGPRDFTVTITPDANGDISVTLPADSAFDSAGNGNIAFDATIDVTVDQTPPTVALSTDSSDVTGPFTVTVSLSEVVEGFDQSDINVTNGVLSNFAGEGTLYTALVTPETLGAITISVADGAATDAAGNALLGTSLGVTATGGDVEVQLEVTTMTGNPDEVGSAFTLSNPGTTPISFTAFSDQPWVDVTPSSGQIGSLDQLEFEIQLNDQIDDLPPGTYVATVTVQVDDPAAAKVGTSSANQASAGLILATVPVTVEVEERFGSFELVVQSPTSLNTGTAFSYASSIAELNGLSVVAGAGESRTRIEDLLNGSYEITQSVPDGWRLESISCFGDTDGETIVDPVTGKIDLDLDTGESISCVFENTRDDTAIRLATQRAIRNFMARRGDRLLETAPDLSKRFTDRGSQDGGSFSANGSALRTQMDFRTSLSGFRNRAASQAVGDNADLTTPVLDGWDIWVSAEYSRVEDERVGSGIDAKFFAAQVGADYHVQDDLLVGALVQYDWMSEQDDALAEGVGAVAGAKVEGDGFMIGPYVVWQATDMLVLDAMGLWGTSDNTVNPLGYYEDDFETSRFMLRANATGEFKHGPWTVRPQLTWSHYQDEQDAYIDTLGIDIPSQTVTIGRLRAGPEILWTQSTDKGADLELGAAIRANWDYDGPGLLDQSGRLSNGGSDLRADGDLLLGLRFTNGASLRARVGIDGIGQGDFNAQSGRFEFNFPFGGQGGSASGGPDAAFQTLNMAFEHDGPRHDHWEDQQRQAFSRGNSLF